MTTHLQRRKRRRNRNHSAAPVATWQPDTNPTIAGTDVPDGEILDGEVEALDPTAPDAADLITATGITLDHGRRRIVGAHGLRHVLTTRAAQPRRLPAGPHVTDYLLANGRGQLLLRYLGDQLTAPPRAINGAALMSPGADVHGVAMSAKPEPGMGAAMAGAPLDLDTGEELDSREETVATPTDHVTEGGESQSTEQEKSSYYPSPFGRLGRPGPAPLEVRIDLLVGGPEGKQLRLRQTVARSEAFVWAARRSGSGIRGPGIAAGEPDLFVTALGAGFRANAARRAGATATERTAGGDPR